MEMNMSYLNLILSRTIMRVKVIVINSVNKLLNNLSEESRFAFDECKNHLRSGFKLLEEHALPVPGYSFVYLTTGELIVVRRQIKQQWFACLKTLQIEIKHLVTVDKVHTLLLRELVKSQDSYQLATIDRFLVIDVLVRAVDNAQRILFISLLIASSMALIVFAKEKLIPTSPSFVEQGIQNENRQINTIETHHSRNQE